jgi:hypothetical protein
MARTAIAAAARKYRNIEPSQRDGQDYRLFGAAIEGFVLAFPAPFAASSGAILLSRHPGRFPVMPGRHHESCLAGIV